MSLLLSLWFRRDRPAVSPTDLDFLHTRARFRDILEVERMRSDRTGSPFTLVVFTIPEAVDRDPALVRFARYLEQRRRATDHIGLMHDRHLGVVLWNTGEPGATTFSGDAVARFDGDFEPEVELYVYPTHVAPGVAESRSDDEPQPPESGPSADELHESDWDAPVEADVATAAPLATTAATAKPLEPLFVRRLPLWKRTLDILGATFGLLVLAPLLLVVAALVKWTSPGPVLFAQRRTGHGGRDFTIFKFRTMCNDAEHLKAALRARSEQDGPAFKLADDPRITRVGRVLRKTCIDELPQLWNVLVGDMTLVGPRPLDVKEADLTTGWERRRLDVTPGLTCIWQVDGKSRVTFAEWMRMDIRYSRMRSFREDTKLVFRTLFAMLRMKASQ